jgi:hypothetical protein
LPDALRTGGFPLFASLPTDAGGISALRAHAYTRLGSNFRSSSDRDQIDDKGNVASAGGDLARRFSTDPET